MKVELAWVIAAARHIRLLQQTVEREESGLDKRPEEKPFCKTEMEGEEPQGTLRKKSHRSGGKI